VEHAALVGTRHAITGETLAPRLRATAAALDAGQIGIGQLRVITETMAALPASVPQPARERAEADLAGYARDFDPRRLRNPRSSTPTTSRSSSATATTPQPSCRT
jgi:hypothetical protein